jgi:hypothetical protein
MNEWTREEAKNATDELIKRATTDAAFRELALKDPAAAIAKIDPKPWPAGFKVQVVAAGGANMTVVLPDMVGKAGELSDAELEQVAGGVGDNNRCGGSCAASCVISSIV